MPDNITAKTGNAKVEKLGQTASNSFGNDPNKQRAGFQGPRDLNAK